MKFRREIRYVRPQGSSSDWFGVVLRDVRESEFGEVPISVELSGERGTVMGFLRSAKEADDTGRSGWLVTLDVAGEPSTISSRDIDAITLEYAAPN